MSTPAVVVDVVTAPDGDVPQEWWAEYDRLHFEPRAARRGVIAARRGTGVIGSAAAIVVYDIADLATVAVGDWVVPAQLAAGPVTVTTTVYRQLISTVDDYRPPATAVLHAAFFAAAPRDHDEFNDWYDTEHIPAIATVDGYDNCRRFCGVDDETKFLALYDVSTLEVAESEDVVVATSSPWSDRIRAKIATYRERRVFLWDRCLP